MWNVSQRLFRLFSFRKSVGASNATLWVVFLSLPWLLQCTIEIGLKEKEEDPLAISGLRAKALAPLVAGEDVPLELTLLDESGQPQNKFTGDLEIDISTSQDNRQTVSFENGMAILTVRHTVAEPVTLKLVPGSGTSRPQCKGSCETDISFKAGNAVRYLIEASQTEATAGSAVPIVIKALDPYGNLDEEHQNTLLVNISGSGTGGGLKSIATGHNSTITVSNNRAESIVITLVDQSSQSTMDCSASLTLQFLPALASQIVMTVAPSDFTAGAFTQFTVEIQDTYGNRVTSDSATSIDFSPNQQARITSILQGTGDGSYGQSGGSESVRVASGLATLRLSDTTAETFNLVVSNSSGLNNPADKTVTVSPALSIRVAESIFGADFLAGGSTTLAIRIEDIYGNLASSDNTTQVTFSPSSNGALSAVSVGSGDGGYGVIGGSETVTVAGGLAQISLTNSTAETFQVAFTNNSGLINPVADSILVSADSAAAIVIAAPGADFSAGASTAVTFHIVDGLGNLRTSDNTTSITLTPTLNGKISAVSTGSGDGSYGIAAGSETISATGGVITVTLSDLVAETFELAVGNGLGLTNPSNDSIQVSPGVRHHITISQAASDFAVGSSSSLTVQVQDANNNLVSSDSLTQITFSPTLGGTIDTVSIGTGDGSYGVAAGPETVSVASGVARVVLKDLAVETFEVAITNNAVRIDPTNDSINVSVGSPYRIVISQAGTDFGVGASTSLSASVLDIGNNVVTTDSATQVTFAPSGGGTVSAVTTGSGDGSYGVAGNSETVTVTNGVATVTLSDLVIETFTVTLTNGSALLNPAADSITTSVGVPTKIGISQAGSDFLAGSSTNLTIQVQDAGGNLVSSNNTAQVTFTPSLRAKITAVVIGTGDGSYGVEATSETVTVANGVATITLENEFVQTFAVQFTNNASLVNPSSDSIAANRPAVIQIAGGIMHTCAVFENKRLKCWGNERSGSLGYNLSGNAREDYGDDEPVSTFGFSKLTNVEQVALQEDVTCALLTGGTVKCWGLGYQGELGRGDGTTSVTDPTAITPISLGGTATQIVSGRAHACALRTDGSVVCWGNGGNGRLGYGNTSSVGLTTTPASAGAVDLGEPATAIFSGSHAYHSCAILLSGALRCWGYGGSGVLGLGNTTTIGANELPSSVAPVSLGSGRTVTQVALNYFHTCALLDDSTVRCFGNGSYGKLGYGNTNHIGDTELPSSVAVVDTSGMAPVVSLSAGYYHTCVLLSDGAIKCWGKNDVGETGYGHQNFLGDDEAVSSYGTISLGTTATQISSGDYHNCAITTSGNLRCWGDGHHGNLGYGLNNNIGDNETPASVGPLSLGGEVITQVATGYNHSCARTVTGKVVCWGVDDSGALGYRQNARRSGDNELPSASGFVSVDSVQTTNQITVSKGSSPVSCAILSDDNVKCWGAAWVNGQGTNNTVGDNEFPSSVSAITLLNGGESVTQIKSGEDSTCALINTGAVRCWGLSGSGQLGYGNTTTIGDNETPLSAGDVSLGAPVTALGGGMNFSCALLNTGDVKCWGSAAGGMLGYGNSTAIGDNELPTAVGTVSIGGTVSQLAVGYAHTCVLLTNNKVRCWGQGQVGSLGYPGVSYGGNSASTLPSVLGDVDVGPGTITKIAAGYSTTCVLFDTGQMKCWGLGTRGQLGYGNKNNIGDDEPPSAVGMIDVGGTVADIYPGRNFTCALLTTGDVKCWGSNSRGRLGYGNDYIIGDNETPASAGDVPLF